MSEKKEFYPVTKEHALWFGMLISEFAHFEGRMHVAAAGILNTDLGTATILLGDMNIRQKIQTLRHLNSTIGVHGKVNMEIKEALEEARKLSKLRGLIAHATWTTGRRPKSIKPMTLQLRGDVPKPRGHDHNEPDYTPDDLESEARRLNCASKKLLKALESGGLLKAVQAKFDATKPAISECEG